MTRSDVSYAFELFPAPFQCFPCFLDMIGIDGIPALGHGSSQGAVDQAARELIVRDYMMLVLGLTARLIGATAIFETDRKFCDAATRVRFDIESCIVSRSSPSSNSRPPLSPVVIPS